MKKLRHCHPMYSSSSNICIAPFTDEFKNISMHYKTLVRVIIILLITGSNTRSATRRYLIYSEADFEVFRPAGATRCTDWDEIWRGGGDRGPLLRAKFHPNRCNS